MSSEPRAVADIPHSDEQRADVARLLSRHARVRERRMFGCPAFFLDGRMIACIYGDEIGIKLPAFRVTELLDRGLVTRFSPYGKTMPQWVSLRQRGDDLEALSGLFDEAATYAGTSQTAKIDVESVDEYIAAHPEAVRTILQRVRNTIRKAVPEAREAISYKMPSYTLHGGLVLYFAAWKKHFSLYPVNERVVASFEHELAPYAISKGTVRFSLTEPVPVKLIARIAKFRAKEIVDRGLV